MQPTIQQVNPDGSAVIVPPVITPPAITLSPTDIQAKIDFFTKEIDTFNSNILASQVSLDFWAGVQQQSETAVAQAAPSNNVTP